MKTEVMINSALNVKVLGHKPTESELKQYNKIENWNTIKVNPTTLFKLLSVGNSVCGAIKTEVKETDESIQSVNALFIDIDKGIDDISQVIDLEFVQTYACLVFQTVSSTPENLRVRVVFLLKNPVSSKLARSALIKLQRVFNQDVQVDESCVNPGRLFYGTTYKKPEYISDNIFDCDGFIDESEAETILSEYDPKISVTLKNSEGRISKKLESHWQEIYSDLSGLIEDPEIFMPMFFPDIDNVGEIKPQEDNVLRQFRGNPTYRESTSGKSFDIFFNEDFSVTWCDKSDHVNLSGHFVDYWYRFRNNDINFGIPKGDHKTFWDTVKSIYAEAQIFFDEGKFKAISAKQKMADQGIDHLEIVNFISFEGKKPVVDSRGVLEYFLSVNPAFYATAHNKYFLFNGMYYEPYSEKRFLRLFSDWIENQFEDKENTVFRCVFTLNKIKSIFNAIDTVIKTVDKPVLNDTGYINFENGIFDIAKQALIEHTPSIIHTYCNPYVFDPNLNRLMFFKDFLSKLIPENYVNDFIKWMACAVSYKAIDAQVCLAAYGDSGSGKTSITNFILNMITKQKLFIDVSDKQSLLTNFLTIFGDKSPYGTADLINKSLVCFSELQDFQNLSANEISNFKTLLGNEDISINYNIKYGAKGSMPSKIAFMLTCESLPDIPIEDEGLLRRLFWVPFTLNKEDLSAEFDRLQDNEFLGSVLSELLVLPVNEYVRYFRSKAFKENDTRSVDVVSHDIYVRFVRDVMEPDPEFSVTLKDLKCNFEAYQLQESEQFRIGKTFSKKLSKAIHIVYKISQQNFDPVSRTFKGIRIK